MAASHRAFLLPQKIGKPGEHLAGAKPFGELVASSEALRIDVRAYGNKDLAAPQKTNVMTATIATPKPITVIAKGSYAGSLNMASISKPQHPPAGRKIKNFAREKFVSANIGRSKVIGVVQRKQGIALPGHAGAAIVRQRRAGSPGCACANMKKPASISPMRPTCPKT